MKNTILNGHLSALFCIIIWSTTYISSKVLLQTFLPVEILVIRFLIGLLVLMIICPKRLEFQGKKELYYIGAGFFGIFIYYQMDNIALLYTMASNLGVIMSIAPFFTAILTQIFYPEEKSFDKPFVIGFLFAITGIALISFNGAKLSINPKGDLLAVLGAFAWAVYSVLFKKINSFGHATILDTKRCNFYGFLFMIPLFFLEDGQMHAESFTDPVILGNFLYLSVLASAVCFVAWNYATRVVGVMTTSIYIYLGPIVTIAASYLILHEPITKLMLLGTVLTLIGLVLSEYSEYIIKYKKYIDN
ncbi:MAG: DMT family transporter [Lachnospiraceae bacterium]|nr:DMT family transporter [Lachnospiraceae bacterium]